MTQRKLFLGATPNLPYTNDPSDLNSNFSKISLKTFEHSSRQEDLRSEGNKPPSQKKQNPKENQHPENCTVPPVATEVVNEPLV